MMRRTRPPQTRKNFSALGHRLVWMLGSTHFGKVVVMTIGDKTQIRRRVKDHLTSLDKNARAAATTAVRYAVIQLPGWEQVRTIAAFMPLPDEPDLSPLSWLPERRVLLPVVRGHELNFYEVHGEEDLVCGSFGIKEPDPQRATLADASQAEVIFVPGLAFTRDGHRLGRGRGFYDRTLATLPRTVLRVGLCFAPQIFDSLPVEDHDQKVDLVLSPPV